MRRYGMRRNSVTFGIGLNMAQLEMLRSYAITRGSCDTVNVLPAKEGGSEELCGTTPYTWAHHLWGHSKQRFRSEAPLETHIPPNDLSSGGVPCASFHGRSERKGMSLPSHLWFRRTGSDCALAIQPVAAFLTELFPREVVIKKCRRTAGASVAIFQGFCLGFGQLTRRIIHVESPRYSPRTSVDLSGDHAWLDTTKVLTISSPAKSLEQFVCLVRTRTAFRGLPEIT